MIIKLLTWLHQSICWHPDEKQIIRRSPRYMRTECLLCGYLSPGVPVGPDVMPLDAFAKQIPLPEYKATSAYDLFRTGGSFSGPGKYAPYPKPEENAKLAFGRAVNEALREMGLPDLRFEDGVWRTVEVKVPQTPIADNPPLTKCTEEEDTPGGCCQ